MLLGHGSPSVRGEVAATVPGQWGAGTVAAIGYRHYGPAVGAEPSAGIQAESPMTSQLPIAYRYGSRRRPI
jgi:hypothetical protein